MWSVAVPQLHACARSVAADFPRSDSTVTSRAAVQETSFVVKDFSTVKPVLGQSLTHRKARPALTEMKIV